MPEKSDTLEEDCSFYSPSDVGHWFPAPSGTSGGLSDAQIQGFLANLTADNSQQSPDGHATQPGNGGQTWNGLPPPASAAFPLDGRTGTATCTDCPRPQDGNPYFHWQQRVMPFHPQQASQTISPYSLLPAEKTEDTRDHFVLLSREEGTSFGRPTATYTYQPVSSATPSKLWRGKAAFLSADSSGNYKTADFFPQIQGGLRLDLETAKELEKCHATGASGKPLGPVTWCTERELNPNVRTGAVGVSAIPPRDAASAYHTPTLEPPDSALFSKFSLLLPSLPSLSSLALKSGLSSLWSHFRAPTGQKASGNSDDDPRSSAIQTDSSILKHSRVQGTGADALLGTARTGATGSTSATGVRGDSKLVETSTISSDSRTSDSVDGTAAEAESGASWYSGVGEKVRSLGASVSGALSGLRE